MTKFSTVTIVVIPAVNFVMKETMLHGVVDMEVQFSVIIALSGATTAAWWCSSLCKGKSQ